jgi:hypothetical protein
MITLKCKCALGKHCLNLGKSTEQYLLELLGKNGEYRKITSSETGKSYKVPVGFILVHGIKGSELNMHGFEEWPEDKKTN